MLQFLKSLIQTPEGAIHAVPAGLRVYAVGDIHGCARELDRLLTRIKLDTLGTEFETHCLFLGDYVDRGPASSEVIDRLSRGDIPGTEHFFLMGNHEEIMLKVLDGQTEHLGAWLRYGGIQTLESYGISRAHVFSLGYDLPGEMRKVIPEAHLQFLRDLQDHAQIGDYLFVHAGIRPGIAIAEQETSDLRWIREGFLNDETNHGVMVVHGHTISSAPVIRSNRIGIDTGCYETRTLTALVLEGNTRRFLTSE